MAAVLVALGAALAAPAASVLQQREAEADASSDQGSAVGGGFRLVVRLAHRPVWRAGLGADAVGDALGGLGFVVKQRAFQAGSLSASLPTLTVVEPIVAAIVEWIALAVSIVAMVVGTVVLSRSAARHDLLHEHEHELGDVLTRGERAR